MLLAPFEIIRVGSSCAFVSAPSDCAPRPYSVSSIGNVEFWVSEDNRVSELSFVECSDVSLVLVCETPPVDSCSTVLSLLLLQAINVMGITNNRRSINTIFFTLFLLSPSGSPRILLHDLSTLLQSSLLQVQTRAVDYRKSQSLRLSRLP